MQQSFLLIVLGAEGHGQEQPFPQPLTSRVPLRSIQLRVILRQASGLISRDNLDESFGDFMVLRLTRDPWDKPREFGLLSDGSLAW